MSITEKLRVLLAEKFKLKPEDVDVGPPPILPTVKWRMMAKPYPYIYGIFIKAYENGKVMISVGSEPTGSEIEEYLGKKGYDRMYEEAKTQEEKEKIHREESKERERIIKDFRQGRFENYLKKRGIISYCAKRHMWGVEIAKRVSEKHGVEVKFEIDSESGFFTTFDSTGMDDEQLINDIMKRVDAIAEARGMFLSEEMMREFLKSKGIWVRKARRR